MVAMLISQVFLNDAAVERRMQGLKGALILHASCVELSSVGAYVCVRSSVCSNARVAVIYLSVPAGFLLARCERTESVWPGTGTLLSAAGGAVPLLTAHT